MMMYCKRLFTITLVVQPILLISDIKSLRTSIRIPIGFALSPHFAKKTQRFRSYYSDISSEQIVTIADKITNYEFEPLPPLSKRIDKNLYIPGETYNIDSTTLKLYAHELSYLLKDATLIGITQVSQERLHAIFLHFRDKWRGTNRLLIYHPNKFYPPIYFGSKVGTLDAVSNISPTYLEDTLNVLKNLTISKISFKMYDIHALEIELVDNVVSNSRYLMRFAPGTRRNNFTIFDITNCTDDMVPNGTNCDVLFNSDEWVFPDKKREIDREIMLKKRKEESRKLYNSNINSVENTPDVTSDTISVVPDVTSNQNTISTNVFEVGTKSGKIPISKLMSQSVPGLSHGIAVDICQSESIPEEKLVDELSSNELQNLMNKVKVWQNIGTDYNKIMPHISHIDDILYFNVTNFRDINTTRTENIVPSIVPSIVPNCPDDGIFVYTSVMEMLYSYYESNTIPYKHRELADKANILCEMQKTKLMRMADSLDPLDSTERLNIIQEKVNLLDKYGKSISECRLYTTMDSYQMLLEMVEDMEELTSSKCTSSKDRIKFKGKALEFDRELHNFITKSDANNIGMSKQNDKNDTTHSYKGLLSVKCLVDDPDSPILVIGRNAKQNEKIVNEIGNPKDMWFHASNVPGAHVLLKSNKDLSNEVFNKVIQFAADVAAYFSKAKGGRKSYTSPNVTPSIGDTTVQVTMAKFSDVIKEEGMEPGAVLVKEGKVIKANPKRAMKKIEDVINQRIKNSQ